jgi:Tfp pilus assembly protein PilV
MPKNKTDMDLSAHTPRLRELVSRDDRGIMLIEVMVSAVLLIVISIATLAVIDRASEASGANRARSVASALGQKDQDRIRQWPFSRFDAMIDEKLALPGDTWSIDDPAGKNITVDGRQYNVKTTLRIVNDPDQEITACLSGWAKKKVGIRTEVTAPAGHKIKSVVMETFRVPQISDKSDTGSVIVKLMRSDGTGAPGVLVTVAPDGVAGPTVTGTTFGDGCVVFNDVVPQKKKITWELADWGDENGALKVTRYVTVAAGKVSQMSGRFDQLASRSVRFVTDGGAEAQWRSATLAHPGITTVQNGRRNFPTSGRALATTVATPNLFPFTTSYGVYAGDCWANNPDVWPGSNTTPGSFAASPGSTGPDPEAYLPLVKIAVNNRNPAGSTSYYALARYRNVNPRGGSGTWSEMSGCGDKVARYTGAGAGDLNGTNNAAGTIQLAMPYGAWQICVTNGSNYRLVDFNNTPDGNSGAAGYLAPTKDYPTNGAGQRGTNVSMSGAPGGGCPTSGGGF